MLVVVVVGVVVVDRVGSVVAVARVIVDVCVDGGVARERAAPRRTGVRRCGRRALLWCIVRQQSGGGSPSSQWQGCRSWCGATRSQLLQYWSRRGVAQCRCLYYHS